MILSHIGKAACLLTSLLFIPAMSVKAQDPQGLTPEMLLPQFSNLSPEAASLGKFGTYNVSEYSGSPNIRIPLFTIQSGDVSIPVELYTTPRASRSNRTRRSWAWAGTSAMVAVSATSSVGMMITRKRILFPCPNTFSTITFPVCRKTTHYLSPCMPIGMRLE